MFKVLQIAWRDFKSVVFTKSFVLGVVLPPVIMFAAIAGAQLLMNKSAPKVAGHVSIIDRTGVVGPLVEKAFAPEEVSKREAAKVEKVSDTMNEVGLMTPEQAEMAKKMAAAAASRNAVGVKLLPGDADPEPAKKSLATVNAKSDTNTPETPLAVAVIPNDAVRKTGDAFGTFDLFVAPKLDVEVQGDISDQISRAIVDARLADSGLDASKVRSIMDRPKSVAKTVTLEGDRKTDEVTAFLIPMGFLMLIWISVFSAGQYLLTSTVEEKSSRVMEVLLSAVSPTELIVGKILGGMGVGLLILVAYASVGGGALVAFKLGHLLDPVMLIYFVIFFILAFFMIASMMAAIGSAVNEMREAQALLGPVMIVLVIPMILWMPIMRNPNSLFAQICSFIPPINPFVMVLRLGGSEKIPHWQVLLSIGVGVAGSVFAAWAAGKVFRIGVLMYGKPPNLPTLIRWVRMS
jgi:ABC-type Na+ efflux pump permease subunit